MTQLFTIENVAESRNIIIMNRDLTADDMSIEDYHVNIDLIRERVDPRYLDKHMHCGWTVALPEATITTLIDAMDIAHGNGSFSAYGGLRGITDSWIVESKKLLASVEVEIDYSKFDTDEQKRVNHFISSITDTINQALSKKDALIMEHITYFNEILKRLVKEHNEQTYKFIKAIAVDLEHVEGIADLLDDNQSAERQREMEQQAALQAQIDALQAQLSASIEKQKSIERTAVQSTLQNELGEHGKQMLEKAKNEAPKKSQQVIRA